MGSSFENSFFGGKAGEAHSFRGGGDTYYISQGNSRQIGQSIDNSTHNHYNTSPPSHSPVLEWLWPQSAPESPGTTQFTKQNLIHRSSTEARKQQADPWLLNRAEYTRWLNGGSLWIRGKVGCGKTVLFSAIIRHIQSPLVSSTQRVRLGYYYCRFQNDTHDDLSVILRRWLAQISDKMSVPTCLQALHDTCHAQYPPRDPTSDELEDALLTILYEHSSRGSPTQDIIFLLIDALDEVSLTDGQSDEILEMLRRLASFKLSGISLLATSRDHAVISEYIGEAFAGISVDYDAVDEEIASFVPRTIEGIPRFRNQPEDLKQAITKRLVSEAKGMFLWVSLQMRLLRSLRPITEASIRRSLSELPKDLNETYRRLLNGISKEFSERALMALKWIVLAPRPLFIEELVEACAFRPGPHPDLQSVDSRLQGYNFFELLQDLIIIEPPLAMDTLSNSLPTGTHIITLAHVSLVEYLTREDGDTTAEHPFRFRPMDGHCHIARSCMCFIYHFNTPNATMEKHPLLRYAWFQWEKHVTGTTIGFRARDRIRTTALKLYKQIRQLSSGDLSASEQTSLSQVLDWLPPVHLERLVNALGIAYFDPSYCSVKDSRSHHLSTYQPLDGVCKAIRLLSLAPSLAIETETEFSMSGRLTITSLENNPKFDALSYVWGNPDSGSSMIVDGVRLFVPRNLHRILETLCAQEDGQTPELWVDAICINQQDMSERNHQVGLIGLIYEAAQEVVICAGAANEDDEDIIAAFANPDSVIPLDDTRSRLLPLDFTSAERVIDLLNGSYWGRMWTIQEIVLAKRGTVLLDPFSFPLSILEDHIKQWRDVQNDHRNTTIMADPRLSQLRTNVSLRLDHRAGRKFELAYLLCKTCGHSCTDLRDKVYSLLGLLSDSDQRQLVPDYCKTAIEVMMDVAQVTLLRGKNLNVLSHVSLPSSRDSNWDRPDKPSWLPTYENDRVPLLPCGDKNLWHFSAGGIDEPVIRETQGIDESGFRLHRGWSDILGVEGFVVDRVEQSIFRHDTDDEQQNRLQTFHTASGARGSGPSGLRDLDVVVIFRGGPVPYILRLADKDKPTWTFIGECLLDGVMHGEAIRGDVKWEMFWMV